MSKRRLRKAVLVLLVGIILTLSCTGCVKRSSGGRGSAGLVKEKQETTVETETTASRGNAKGLFVVTSVNTTESKVSLEGIEDGSVQVLTYGGGTSVQNRFGTEILMQDVSCGEIVEVTFVLGTQKLISMKESNQAWENTTVNKWSVDYERKMIQIGSENFFYDEDLLIFSGTEKLDIHELHTIDDLVVKGVDKKIYSINVKTGHGYVKVINETNMVGGLIEIGTDIMTAITEDMILVAPEGTHTLTASKNGVGGSKEIEIKRGKETTVSISEFQGNIKRQGSLRLNILPENVQYSVFIDGKPVDITKDLELAYGVHSLVVTSSQYADYTESVVISSVYMNKTIDLDTEEETSTDEETTKAEETETTKPETTKPEEETSKENTGDESEMQVTMTKTYNNQVVITGPVGAEIYLDGISVGISPLTLAKKEGQRIFVLRKDGYETEAYTYTFDSTTEDVYIKFPEMKTKAE